MHRFLLDAQKSILPKAKKRPIPKLLLIWPFRYSYGNVFVRDLCSACLGRQWDQALSANECDPFLHQSRNDHLRSSIHFAYSENFIQKRHKPTIEMDCSDSVIHASILVPILAHYVQHSLLRFQPVIENKVHKSYDN